MKLINSIDRIFARLEGFLIVCLLSIMIVLSFGQMVSRNFFNQALIWGDTLLRQLVLWTGFLGASLAVSKNKHISIDALSNFLPPKYKKNITNLNCFFASIISGFLAWAAWSFVLFEKESESILFLDLPVWVFLLILPYSFLMIAFRFLLKSIERSKENSIQETS
ncbi:MAG: TRAP transporter small permease [Nitrospinota bacterium]